jgi:Trk K+ transport system NAD-binding subunit
MLHAVPTYVRHRRRAVAYVRYLRALVARFRVTLLLSSLLFGGAPLAYVALYRGPNGERVGFGEAFHHVYFLLYGQPSLPYVDALYVEALNLLIPPFGIAVVVDGMVRFGLLALHRERNDREWVAVQTEMLEGHVIVCGGGRIGCRVATQLRGLGKDVVVVERNAEGTYLAALREQDVLVLVDDIRSKGCLERLNVARAAAVVCTTDDDLANLNFALDARRLNANVRLVLRLFDDDLAATVRATFGAEAMSTSAVAAPAIALAALDPRIDHSFRVGAHLMVVSQFTVRGPLVGLLVRELNDRFGGLVLAIHDASGGEKLHPSSERPLVVGERATVQADYGDYLALRAFTGEADPPMRAT